MGFIPLLESISTGATSIPVGEPISNLIIFPRDMVSSDLYLEHSAPVEQFLETVLHEFILTSEGIDG